MINFGVTRNSKFYVTVLASKLTKIYPVIQANAKSSIAES